MYGEVYAARHFDGKHFDADGRGRRKIALKQVDVHTRHAISLTHLFSDSHTCRWTSLPKRSFIK